MSSVNMTAVGVVTIKFIVYDIFHRLIFFHLPKQVKVNHIWTWSRTDVLHKSCDYDSGMRMEAGKVIWQGGQTKPVTGEFHQQMKNPLPATVSELLKIKIVYN